MALAVPDNLALPDNDVVKRERPEFEANFKIKCLSIQSKPGEPSLYEFKLTMSTNNKIRVEREHWVQLTETRFPYAIEDFALATGEFLDVIPAGRVNHEEFVRRAIREYFDGEDEDPDEDVDERERIFITSPGIKKIKNKLYYITSETEIYRFNEPTNDSPFTTRINPEEANFKLVFKCAPIAFGRMPSGEVRRVLPEDFSDTCDGYYVGPTEPDPQLTFQTDEENAIRHLIKLLEVIEKVKDESSKSSMMAFFLQFERGLLFDVLKINHKLGILCSEVTNTGKSAYVKIMSLLNFGYKMRMLKGFTEAFAMDELCIPNRIIVIDELTKTDPVDETAKGQWNRSFKGKVDTRAKNQKKNSRIPRSTLLLATNKPLEQFVAYHKIEKSTVDKMEFNFLGYRSVDKVNPSNFKELMEQAMVIAAEMFPFAPVYLAIVKVVCEDRVSSAEILEMKKYGKDVGERLGESLAHLYRFFLLLREKAETYHLQLPKCLQEFDPTCLTEALSSSEREFRDLFKLILDKLAVHLIEPITGSQDIRMNNAELEKTEWFPPWGKATYRKMEKCQKKKEKRCIRVTRNDVGIVQFNKALRLISVSVETKGEEECAKTEKRSEELKKEGMRAIGLLKCSRKETERGSAELPKDQEDGPRGHYNPSLRIESSSENESSDGDESSSGLKISETTNRMADFEGQVEEANCASPHSLSTQQIIQPNSTFRNSDISVEPYTTTSVPLSSLKAIPSEQLTLKSSASIRAQSTKVRSNQQCVTGHPSSISECLQMVPNTNRNKKSPVTAQTITSSSQCSSGVTGNADENQQEVHSSPKRLQLGKPSFSFGNSTKVGSNQQPVPSQQIGKGGKQMKMTSSSHRSSGVTENTDEGLPISVPGSSGNSTPIIPPKRQKLEKSSFSCGIPACKTFTQEAHAAEIKLKNLMISDKKKQLRKSNRKTETQLKHEETEKILRELRRDNDNEIGLEVGFFGPKGRGVLTTRDRSKGEFVVEYSGELIDGESAKQREAEYSTDSNIGCYMYYFEHLGTKFCIDATKESGRLGRLLNHSRKNPNLITKVMTVDNSPRLYLVAKTDIAAGTQLLYDYGDRNKNIKQIHPWMFQE